MAEEPLDPDVAMVLLQEQERRVRTALDPGLPLTLLVWGIAWSVGFGSIWWQVRAQTLYQGPQGAVAGLFAALLTSAGIFTAWRTQRAIAGIAGETARRGRLFGISWCAGLIALFVSFTALGRAGATPSVLGVLGVCGPLLVVGLMHLFGAAAFGSRVMAVLGGWLLVLAASLGYAGPVAAAGLTALLAGGGFLVAAAFAARGVR